ncbi:hypothetical protein GIB67_012292 [Kingdonia uniflora]|uniref:Uncharacterized protein n=1 Tax=Kingdonia uniflora TaxID=39325 RepID=A0A7J7N497_9MAGN|nr:hypothetical protein GIB67_023396 [Kingdonia uniflora]KAF6161850.1 hypothetical protein GIB67_012292 [Kingdonia uniflora]
MYYTVMQLLEELKKQSSAEIHLHDLRTALGTLATEGFVVFHGDTVKRSFDHSNTPKRPVCAYFGLLVPHCESFVLLINYIRHALLWPCCGHPIRGKHVMGI